MPASAPASRGLLGSLRDLGDSLLGTAHERLELFSIELHEEKFRLIQIFLWISIAILTGMLAITFASLLLVFLFWETARIEVLTGLTLFYVGGTVAIVLKLKRFIAKLPRPFDATIAEFKSDRACIRSES